jgi:phosphoribosyl-AMP cyclohydrolase
MRHKLHRTSITNFLIRAPWVILLRLIFICSAPMARLQTSSRKESSMSNWLDAVKWDADGLVPAIAQDHKTGRILMMAWMNREALALTAQENRAIYYSRSRQKLWRKGEESGHVQHLHELRLDCDADVIVMQVEQVGGIACHTGRESCFYQVYQDGDWVAADPVLKDPKDIY